MTLNEAWQPKTKELEDEISAKESDIAQYGSYQWTPPKRTGLGEAFSAMFNPKDNRPEVLGIPKLNVPTPDWLQIGDYGKDTDLFEYLSMMPLYGEMVPFAGKNVMQAMKLLPARTATVARKATAAKVTPDQIERITSLVKEKNMFGTDAPRPAFDKMVKQITKKSKLADITYDDANKLIESLQNQERLATFEQLTEGHEIARAKGLIRPNGKKAPEYYQWAKYTTGKTSMADMTTSEAAHFNDTIGMLKVRGNKIPSLPKTKSLVPIGDKILNEFNDLYNEVGFIEKYRQPHKVLLKIGLPWDVAISPVESSIKIFNETEQTLAQLQGFKKSFGKNWRESAGKVFDALEDPTNVSLLNKQEQDAYNWAKKYYDIRADELKIPDPLRKKNYVTHIFDETVRNSIENLKTIDSDLARAMEFQVPSKTYMPYLKRRMGADIGLKRNFMESIEAYEKYALRKKYYTPVMAKLGTYREYLPANSRKYLEDYIRRIAGRPTMDDRLANESLKQLAVSMQKLGKPGQALAKVIGDPRKNPAAMIAYNYSNILFTSWLGFKPASALRNFTQQLLAFAESPASFGPGVALRFTDEGKKALSQSVMLKSRVMGYVPGTDEAAIRTLSRRMQDIALTMFKASDKENVANSFLTGYHEAKKLGLPLEWAVKRGDEVAANTQFIYAKLARSTFEDSVMGKFLTPFTSYPRNFMELLAQWGSGKQSAVYQEYMKMTGKTLKLATNPIAKRKALLVYMALVGAAYAGATKSRINWPEYTGWTSVKTIADIFKGELPSLDLIGGLADVVAGATTNDDRRLQEGWDKVRPDKFIGIVNTLERIAEGKSDWLSLFVYLNQVQKKKSSKVGTGYGK